MQNYTMHSASLSTVFIRYNIQYIQRFTNIKQLILTITKEEKFSYARELQFGNCQGLNLLLSQ